METSTSTLELPPTHELENVIFRSVFLAVFMFLTGILGLFGNIVSLIIFKRREMKSPITLLLTHLCYADLVLILLCLAIFGVRGAAIMSTNPGVHAYGAYTTVTVYPISMMAQSVRVWLLVLITGERFMAVAFPLKVRRSLSHRRTGIAIGVVVTLAIFYNLIRYGEWAVVSRTVMLNDTTPMQYKALTPVQRLRTQKFYFLYYYTILYLLTHFVIPFIIIVALNIGIMILVERAKHMRRSIAAKTQREYQISLMMMTVIALFALTRTMPFVLNIIEAAKPSVFRNLSTRPIAYLALDISNLLIVLNSSITWLCYTCFNRRYRQTMRYLFCKPTYGEDRSIPFNQYATTSQFPTYRFAFLKHRNSYVIGSKTPLSSRERQPFLSLNRMSPSVMGTGRSRSAGMIVRKDNNLICQP